MMIVNHCHIVPEGTKKEDPSWGSVRVLKEWMKELGFEKAVAFAPFQYQMEGDPNEWLHEVLKREEIFYGFATINPSDEGAADKLREHIRRGFVGAKIHPPIFKIQINDPAIDDFFAAAEELRIPIVIHTGVHGWFLSRYRPILIDDVAQRHPELPIIIAHVGGTAFFEEAFAVICNNKNCYAGITQVRRENTPFHISNDRIRILLRTVGARKLIYGADYPYDNLDGLRADLEWIKSWGLSVEEQRMILGENIRRLIERE